jgi:hypothetical protein
MEKGTKFQFEDLKELLKNAKYEENKQDQEQRKLLL